MCVFNLLKHSSLEKKRKVCVYGGEILLWGEPKPPNPKVTSVLKFGSLSDSTFRQRLNHIPEHSLTEQL